ncbi:MAG: hypothetical protein OWU84_02245 [Firmicutes bacterium]|nr:hypothetical protein [Bacillota bacterium]
MARLSPSTWGLLGLWTWLPVALFVYIWTGLQVRLGWSLAIREALELWGGLAVSRALGALCYNEFVAGWVPFKVWIEAGRVVRFGDKENLGAMISFALPFSLIQGWLAGSFGWATVLGGRWWLISLALFTVALLYAVGGVTVYNRIVVRWYGPLVARQAMSDGDALHIVALDARSVGWTVAVCTLFWAGLGVLAVACLGGVLLAVLAGHVPGGVFGAEIGGFAVMSALLTAYGVAVAFGAWMSLGARMVLVEVGLQRASAVEVKL